MADLHQLTLGGEFAWTAEDDKFVNLLPPGQATLVRQFSLEYQVRPREAFERLRLLEVQESTDERRQSHAP